MDRLPMKFGFRNPIPVISSKHSSNFFTDIREKEVKISPKVRKITKSSAQTNKQDTKSIRASLDNNELIQHVKSIRGIVTCEDTYDIVVGHEAVKDAIESAFISFNCLKVEINSVLCVKSILLVGVPGIGKTDIMCNIGGKIAKLIKKNVSVFMVSAAEILFKYVGESEKSVNALWDVAEHYAPSIVLLDEVDALMKSRNDDESDHSRRTKNKMLAQMDGVRTFKNVVTIAATNRGFDLDDAFLRRFKRKFFLRPPNGNERIQILQTFLSKDSRLPHLSMNSAEEKKFAEITQNFTGDDIKTAVSFAVAASLRVKHQSEEIDIKNLSSIRKRIGDSVECPVAVISNFCIESLFDAVHGVVPSCNSADLKRQLRWDKKHCKDSNYNHTSGYLEMDKTTDNRSKFICCACFQFL